MFLVLVAILLIASIDYALGNKFSYAITDCIEYICSKLFNKKSTDVNQTSDVDKKNEEKKETTKFFMRPKFFGEKEYLPMQGLQVTTPSFIVPIHFNTTVNILEMVGLNNERWIVDRKRGFELNIRSGKLDISVFCTERFSATHTIVFFIGENNKFSLTVNFDSGETVIKTNSKEFESELAILTFGAKHIDEIQKNYYGKAGLELSRKAKKILEESENNKIGDDNV